MSFRCDILFVYLSLLHIMLQVATQGGAPQAWRSPRGSQGVLPKPKGTLPGHGRGPLEAGSQGKNKKQKLKRIVFICCYFFTITWSQSIRHHCWKRRNLWIPGPPKNNTPSDLWSLGGHGTCLPEPCLASRNQQGDRGDGPLQRGSLAHFLLPGPVNERMEQTIEMQVIKQANELISWSHCFVIFSISSAVLTNPLNTSILGV